MCNLCRWEKVEGELCPPPHGKRPVHLVEGVSHCMLIGFWVYKLNNTTRRLFGSGKEKTVPVCRFEPRWTER